MIKFRCSSCNQKIGVPEKYAGKNVKCPKCQCDNLAPTIEIMDPVLSNGQMCIDDSNGIGDFDLFADISEQDIDTSNFVNRKKAVPANESNLSQCNYWIWFVAGSVAILFICFLIWAFLLRDTWEVDNYDTIVQLADDASMQILAGSPKEGLELYEELFDLIGDRKLKITNLQAVYKESKDNYDSVKLRWRDVYKPMQDKQREIENLISTFQYSDAIKQCNTFLEKSGKYKHDPAVKRAVDYFHTLRVKSEEGLKQEIKNEKEIILPKMLALKKEAEKYAQQNLWAEAAPYLDQILWAKPMNLHTTEVADILEYAQRGLTNTQWLPGIIELLKEAEKYSQMQDWRNAITTLQKVIDSEGGLGSTQEIDLAVSVAREQLSFAKKQLEAAKRIEVEQERAIRFRILSAPKVANVYYDADLILSFMSIGDVVEKKVICLAIDKANTALSYQIVKESSNNFSRAVDNPRNYGSLSGDMNRAYWEDKAVRDLADAKVIFNNYSNMCAGLKETIEKNPDVQKKWDDYVRRYKNSEFLPDVIKNHLMYSNENFFAGI